MACAGRRRRERKDRKEEGANRVRPHASARTRVFTLELIAVKYRGNWLSFSFAHWSGVLSSSHHSIICLLCRIAVIPSKKLASPVRSLVYLLNAFFLAARASSCDAITAFLNAREKGEKQIKSFKTKKQWDPRHTRDTCEEGWKGSYAN